MQTKRLTGETAEAAGIIAAGGLVAVPTETVYGLAGNGLDRTAVEKIYEVKGRPAAKPLSLMVPGQEAMLLYCKDVPGSAYALAERFWPGPLTIILKAKDIVPAIVRAGGDTVGLRCPDQADTLALLKACGLPLAAPSANLSGAPSPKTAADVAAYFDGKIEAILDGGECGIGTESTIIDLTRTPYAIVRQGALPEADIRRALIASLKIVGVTGGTGTGKSTALEALSALGALIIDADEVYHRLCRESEDMLVHINDRFPGAVENGVLQRKKLGSVVFSDPAALGDLRRITDAYVEKEIDRLLAEHAAAGGLYAAVDAINILDTNMMAYLTAVVGVTAPEEARIARLMARESITADYARLRIHAQRPSSYYEAHCDYTICNDGSVADYRSKCTALFEKILREGSNNG